MRAILSVSDKSGLVDFALGDVLHLWEAYCFGHLSRLVFPWLVPVSDRSL